MDMEINHPVMGWVQWTANPLDRETIEDGSVVLGKAMFDAALATGTVADFVPLSGDAARADFPALSPRQLRLVMLDLGLSDADIVAKINAIGDEKEREASMIEWKFATKYERLHPLVVMLASEMGFPPEQFDDLWLYGAGL
ncbi:MAG: hypothetical protein ACTHJ3_19585 [Pararhizobium sp.]